MEPYRKGDSGLDGFHFGNKLDICTRSLCRQGEKKNGSKKNQCLHEWESVCYFSQLNFQIGEGVWACLKISRTRATTLEF